MNQYARNEPNQPNVPDRAGQRPMHPMLSIGARAPWGPGLKLKGGTYY